MERCIRTLESLSRRRVRARLREHGWIAFTTAAFIVLVSSAGCATAPTPQTITEMQQLVGRWRGSVPCRDCPRYLPATLLIRDDGTWTATVDQSHARTHLFHQASNLQGALAIVDGVLRWGQDGRWYGRATVAERRGYEYLTMLTVSGDVWLEFQRAK